MAICNQKLFKHNNAVIYPINILRGIAFSNLYNMHTKEQIQGFPLAGYCAANKKSILELFSNEHRTWECLSSPGPWKPTLVVVRAEYSASIGSMPYLLFPWLSASPGHQGQFSVIKIVCSMCVGKQKQVQLCFCVNAGKKSTIIVYDCLDPLSYHPIYMMGNCLLA